LGRGVILCFGDSLTEGYCDSGCRMRPYSDRLEEVLRKAASGLPSVVISAGVSGETTKQMLRRLPCFLASSQKIDVVLILGGTNDLGRGVPTELIVEQLISLHDMVHGIGAVSGVLTIPEIRMGGKVSCFADEREAVNAALRRYAEDRPERTFFVDVAAAFPQDGAHARFWEPDGVHFSEEGYRALGELLAGARLPRAAAASSAGGQSWAQRS